MKGLWEGMRMRNEAKKSALAVQAEKFFQQHGAIYVAPEPTQPYGDGMRVVQSYTTYSACEAPIPAPAK